METKQAIEKVAKLKQSDIGSTEENVKQKVIVPILELLGHKKEDLEFEYRTRTGSKLDIYIKNVPSDCKVIVDTKNYNENLNDHIEQIKDYTFDENALLTVIANGSEIRIYSPLRGVAFERSLLYSIKRQDLSKESIWATLSSLLHKNNLQNRSVISKIEQREREIRDAIMKEDSLKQECDSKIGGIDNVIETKEEEIEQLKTERENLIKEAETKKSEIWGALGLIQDFFKIPTSPSSGKIKLVSPHRKVPKRKVTLQELVDAGLVRNGQTLYFLHGSVYRNEQAEIVSGQNKLKYKDNGELYSISDLAANIERKLGFNVGAHGVAGPNYWQTEDGKLLYDLNEIVRQQSQEHRSNRALTS